MPVIEVDFKNKCLFCNREATKLCDKVTGEYTFAGHPPKGSGLPLHNVMMCSRPICDKCATHINGMDLCPKCVKEIKAVLIQK
jgi:hypothetical protein